METARDRVYRLLLTYPREPWTQKDLAARAGCSRGYVSRVVDALVTSGVLTRPYKNRTVLLGPAKLLTLWASRRTLPAPVHVATDLGAADVEARLLENPGTALTLFRAAWHRTKFMATSGVEAYVRQEDLERVADCLGERSAEPTSVALYPAQGPEFEGVERIDGRPLVSVPQNVVDLMAIGGQGPRVALHLAHAYDLWEA